MAHIIGTAMIKPLFLRFMYAVGIKSGWYAANKRIVIVAKQIPPITVANLALTNPLPSHLDSFYCRCPKQPTTTYTDEMRQPGLQIRYTDYSRVSNFHSPGW